MPDVPLRDLATDGPTAATLLDLPVVTVAAQLGRPVGPLGRLKTPAR